MEKKILILGGSGRTGGEVARQLLPRSKVRICLAGRNAEHLETAAGKLRRDADADRISWVQADATSPDSLSGAFQGIDIVVVCSPPCGNKGREATAALEAGADLLDLRYDRSKTAPLKNLEPTIRANRRCFVADAGVLPGLPALLVRFGSQMFSKLEHARVGCVTAPCGDGATRAGLTAAAPASGSPGCGVPVYRDGEWGRASPDERISMDFGEPVGERLCTPAWLDEMEGLPADLPELLGAALYLAEPVPATLPTVLRLESSGEQGHNTVRLSIQLGHPDGRVFAAAVATACLLQLLDGSARRTGLHWMGRLVDPGRVVADLRAMGVSFDLRMGD